MNDNINFKDLWAQQTTSPPDLKDLLLKVKQLKRAATLKIVVTNVLLACTIAFVLFIWLHYQPELLITKIGILLTILAMVIQIITSNQLIPLFKNAAHSESNSDYLKALLRIKTKQQFLQTTIMNLYFLLLSLGIGLYMFEFVRRMTVGWAVFAYGITLAWILFNWFYTRVRQIKKQQSKLDEVIRQFEMLNKQFEN